MQKVRENNVGTLLAEHANTGSSSLCFVPARKRPALKNILVAKLVVDLEQIEC